MENILLHRNNFTVIEVSGIKGSKTSKGWHPFINELKKRGIIEEINVPDTRKRENARAKPWYVKIGAGAITFSGNKIGKIISSKKYFATREEAVECRDELIKEYNIDLYNCRANNLKKFYGKN